MHKHYIRFMRVSRNASVLSNSEKLLYPKCDRKKEHAKEAMSFICLSPNLKLRGLICALCKTSAEFSGQNIQPVRAFLTRMDDALRKKEALGAPKMTEEPDRGPMDANLLQRLQETHLDMLAALKIQVEQISERVMQCEDDLLREYDKTKERLIGQLEKDTLIGKILGEIQGYFSEEKEKESMDLKLSVLKLLSLVKVEKQEISIQSDADAQFNAYQLGANAFKMNLLAWEQQTINIIGDIFRIKPEYQLREHKIRPMTAGDLSSKVTTLTFSPTLKTDSIVLANDNKLVKVKDDKHGKVILLCERVTDFKGTLKLKLAAMAMGSQMQVGVCLKNAVSAKSYKFDKSGAQHGYFVFSSNGFIYSHGDAQANNSKSGFMFKVNDQLHIEAGQEEGKLSVKKKQESKSHDLSLKHLHEGDWNDLYFCVSLHQINDKVQVLA